MGYRHQSSDPPVAVGVAFVWGASTRTSTPHQDGDVGDGVGEAVDGVRHHRLAVSDDPRCLRADQGGR